MNEEQHLTYELGMTNVPSDATCDDNGLEESIGLTFADGEHRVIQKPITYMTGLSAGKKLLYVHTRNNVENYIIRDSNDIKWGTKDVQNNEYVPAQTENDQDEMVDIVLFTASGDVQVTSIGKTLIFTDNNGLHYFKFDGSGYKNLPFPVPDLNFEAKVVVQAQDGAIVNTGDADGIIDYDSDGYHIHGGKQEDFNNLVIGLYSKNKKEVASYKGFMEPFFVRAALEMYDGTYTYISNPILLYPSVTENTRFYIYGRDGIPYAPQKIIAASKIATLYIKQLADYNDYSDIIKDVVIFASKGISLYNTSGDQYISQPEGDYIIGDGITSEIYNETPDASIYRQDSFTPGQIPGLIPTTSAKLLTQRASADINKDIEDASVFYKIASIGLNPTGGFVSINGYMREHVLENLETQESLEYDDYYSRNRLIPRISYVYNSRLNLANVSRDFFNGYSYFMPFDHEDSDSNVYSYTFDVTIRTDIGDVVVRTSTDTRQKQGIYFFYPDSRATHVTIYKSVWGGGIRCILDANLKEHPGLNGAYYFAGYIPSTDEPTGTIISSIPSIPPHEPEQLYNNIIQSEVNNPWAFLAQGYHTVGTGEIIGLSTITQALSEGQFGQYPLLVFSENGVWTMSVDGKGTYSSMSPMSREICNRAKSITQTDGAVFFSSEKGLMVVVGSEVRCVSEQLSGRSNLPFADYLKDAIIAYDYRDSLLWIFDNKTRNGVVGLKECYVYSIKSGTFARYDFGTVNNNPVIVTNVVANYPDYLLQIGTDVFSLLNRPNINSDTNTYSASIITRAMKLGGGMTLKSIMRMKNVFDISGQNGSLSVEIWAKNNLNDAWVRLTHLRGVPHKYYQLRYTFTGLRATDRFAGTVLITQERRTNKLR